MQRLISEILERAEADRRRIVLPEGTEERTSKAANQILIDGIADLILLDNPAEINTCATEWGPGDISKAITIDPENDPKQEKYAQLLFKPRKKEGMTTEGARRLATNLLHLGYLIIKNDDADSQLAGVRSIIGDVFRPALQVIKIAPGITCVSGTMLLLTHAPGYGKSGVLVVGNIAVTPVPDTSQLAQIAICTTHTVKAVAGFDPKAALLSFSTKDSAKHEVMDKVVEALKIAKKLVPDIAIDDGLQADIALVPEIGVSKAPGSAIAGNVNMLVVPSPEVGNISYKLVQYLGYADAVSSILQGVTHSINDLSRGYSIEDVYRMIAITAGQVVAARHNK